MRLRVRVLGSIFDPNRLADVWEFEIPGGMVLARPFGDRLYILNQTAGFIWRQFRSGEPAVSICAGFAEAFGVAAEVAERDVKATLEGWERTVLAEAERAAEAEEVVGVAGLRFSEYVVRGKRFRIGLDSEELEAEIGPRLAQFRLAHFRGGEGEADFTLSAGARDGWIRLARGGKVFGREETVSGARAILLQEVVRLAEGEGEWVALLHAGSCVGEGGCVVFPGPSGAGKSTLAAVMGEGFHSDDSVGVMKGSLRVPGMPFGMAIREGSWGVVGSRVKGFWELPVVERFGQQVRFLRPVGMGGAARAVALVFPRWEAGVATRVTRLGMVEALVRLTESGFWCEHSEAGIREFLGWVEGLPAYAISYSEVEEAILFMKTLNRG